MQPGLRSRTVRRELPAGTSWPEDCPREEEALVSARIARAVLAVTALGLILAPLTPLARTLAWPVVAAAGGTACTTTGLGPLCNRIDGRGLHVGVVRVWLSTNTWTCNKEFRVRGTLSSGWAYERSAVSQCAWSRAFMQFGVGEDFANGSYVCVAVREYGRGDPWEPYEACSRIRR
jgi:hypothetical protein